MRFKFKDELNLAQRKTEVRKITGQYPDKVPVIVERRPGVGTPNVGKSRFLAPRDITIEQFVYIIRTRLQEPYKNDLYLYIDNQMLQNRQLVGDIYWRFKDKDDGFLYLSFSDKRPFDFYLDLFNATNIVLLVLILIVFYYLLFN